MKTTFRYKVYNALNMGTEDISITNKILIMLILLSITVSVLETEKTIYESAMIYFYYLNIFFCIIFTLEYIFRLWASAENEEYQGFSGKIKYMKTSFALIDLVALIPLYLVYVSHSFVTIKAFRILRIISLLKLNRYSKALYEVLDAIKQKRYELIVSLGITFFSILIASAVMYAIEGDEQPESFGSIPRAMWWGLITLTTIGYGDQVPISLLGKAFTGFYAIMTLGLVAMVGGIMAGAFVETFENMKSADLDNEYPRDEDYQNYEMGFICGKRDKLNHKPYQNPYPDEEYMICLAKGYDEGYKLTKYK